VPGFRSLLGAFPYNTIGVYSYSKYFGCTGWRLGVIAVQEDNLFDKLIAQHAEPILKKLDKRYSAITLEPRKLRFIDRIVADSRDVALNHTAGLSLPQQVMMALFSLYELMDHEEELPEGLHRYRQERVEATLEGLGIEVAPNELYDYYYGLIDLEFWARKYVGEDVVTWMKENVHPLDFVFRLAEDHGIVLLNGSGFEAPDWSVRVSFANLNDHVYDDIGRAVRAVGARIPAGVRGIEGQGRRSGEARWQAARQEVGTDNGTRPAMDRPASNGELIMNTDQRFLASRRWSPSVALPRPCRARTCRRFACWRRRHDRRRTGQRDRLRLQVRRLRRELVLSAVPNLDKLRRDHRRAGGEHRQPGHERRGLAESSPSGSTPCWPSPERTGS